MSKLFKLFLSALMLCAIPVAAQVNTGSPYSRFGLGELSQPGFAQNLSMGGTGIGIRPESQINYLNPAAFSAIDTMSFLFDFGIQGSQTKYSTNTLNSSLANYNIHHIAIGFPITKNWKASVGIIPYSSVGYNIIDNSFVTGVGLVEYSYKGNGGLNRFFMGNSVQFLNHFSAGINLSYMFGYLDYQNTVDFPADAMIASTTVENRLTLGDMMYNLGVQYYTTFNEKYFLTVGAIFDNESKLKTSRSIIQTSYFPGTITGIGDSITIDPDFVVNSENHSENTLFPRNIGGGFSFGIKNKLLLAGDFSTTEWSKSFIPGKSDSLSNSNLINFGLEFTPDYQALRGYYKRVHYRLGGYFANTYLSIREQQIQDYGISFGVGLPFKGTRSSFNLGVIVGQRGTLTNNLIKENYGVVNFGLTLHDFWFFKRKID